MRPKPGDYNPYYDRYISLIEGDDIIEVLKDQIKLSEVFLRNLTEEYGNYSYEEGKWTVNEVLGHVIDTERIMAYRALAFARNEEQPLPGFEQDDYVIESNFNERKLDNLVNEFIAVRESNIILFKSFDKDILKRKGTASDNEISVIALIYIIAGHEKHHLRILKERYLK